MTGKVFWDRPLTHKAELEQFITSDTVNYSLS
jgi:hypothetical protein